MVIFWSNTQARKIGLRSCQFFLPQIFISTHLQFATMESLQQSSLTFATKFPSFCSFSPTPNTFKFLHPFPSSAIPLTATTPKRISSFVPKAAASTAAFAQDIGDVLADVSIFTATGQSVKFEDLWDQNEVLLFHNSNNSISYFWGFFFSSSQLFVLMCCANFWIANTLFGWLLTQYGIVLLV